MTQSPPAIVADLVEHTPRFDEKTVAKSSYFENLFTVYDAWISYLAITGIIGTVTSVSALRSLSDSSPVSGQSIVINNQLKLVSPLGLDGTNSEKAGLYIYKASDSTTDLDGSSANYDSDGVVEPSAASGRWHRIDGASGIQSRGDVIARTLYNWLKINLDTDKSINKTDIALEVFKRSTSSLVKIVSDAVVEYHSQRRTFTADTTTNVITSTAHGFSDGDEVRVESTGTLPAPLSDTTLYYVISSTTNTFKVSTTSGGSEVDITDAGTGTFYITGNQSIKAKSITTSKSATIGTSLTTGGKITSGDGLAVNKATVKTGTVTVSSGVSTTFTANTILNTIVKTSHGRSVGDLITFTSTATLPAPLKADALYYISTIVNADNFTISEVSGGGNVDITSSGSGTHTYYLSSKTLTSTAHTLVNGDRVRFSSTGTVLPGVDSTKNYIVSNVATDTFEINSGGSSLYLGDSSSITGTNSFTLVHEIPIDGGVISGAKEPLLSGDLATKNYADNLPYRKIYFVDRTGATVNNTASLTSVFSKVLPAGLMNSSTGLRVILEGYYLNNTGGSRDLSVKVSLGSSNFTTLAQSHPSSANTWGSTIDLLIDPAKARTAQSVYYKQQDCERTPNGNNRFINSLFSFSEDLLTSLTLDVSVQHSTAGANLTYGLYCVILELVGGL